MQRSITLLLLIAPAVASSCHGDDEVQYPKTTLSQSTTAQAQEGGSHRFITLADSIAPLSERFNAHKDKVRFLTILSPT